MKTVTNVEQPLEVGFLAIKITWQTLTNKLTNLSVIDTNYLKYMKNKTNTLFKKT